MYCETCSTWNSNLSLGSTWGSNLIPFHLTGDSNLSPCSTGDSNLSPFLTGDSNLSHLVQLRTQISVLWFNSGLKFESFVSTQCSNLSPWFKWDSNLSPLFTQIANFNEFLSQLIEVLDVLLSLSYR